MKFLPVSRSFFASKKGFLGLVLILVLCLLATDADAQRRRRKGKRGRGRGKSSIGTSLPRGTFKTISAEEFQKLMQKPNSTVIDLRTEKEWDKGHIEDALRIDYLEKAFQETIAKLPKNITYLVYCESGYRSSEAMQFMKSVGFRRVYELKDGFAEWPY